uniref:Terminal ear1-like 1 protein n=1 Tax=Populus canescens TaxID=80863 RepID=A9XIW6_POPCN|nr:terminal ear1-like 1 protein [Populus tremula x Populus alba]
MEETGCVPFPGNLDPRAQEFRPRHNNLQDFTTKFPPFGPPPPPPPPQLPQLLHQVYYPYTPQAVPDGQNQGTLVVFNLDPNVSTKCLKETFQAFGKLFVLFWGFFEVLVLLVQVRLLETFVDYFLPANCFLFLTFSHWAGAVKELRETPLKRHQRFVEFYDVRDAAKALGEMNGKEIYGKQVDIEFSRPGGYGKKFFNANTTTSKTSFSAPAINSTTSLNRSRISTYASPPSPPLLRRFSSGCSSPNISPRSFLSETHSSAGKKPSGNPGKGNPNEASNEAASSGCLSLGGGAVGDGIVEKVTDHGPPKKSSKKSQNSQSFTATKHQQKSAKSWKGTRQAKKFDTRFLISGDESMVETSGSDSRTTVMIKNIPNKYSQKLLLNMLDNHCIHCNEQIADGDDDQPLSSYDFLYLPIDFNNKCNVGYGFVNMTSPQAAWRLYKAFHNQHWEVFNSRKICAVTYARVQGLEALKEHFKNSKFPCEMDHYLPVVFSPPRDGRQQTEPLPIIGLKQLQQPINLGHRPHHEIEDGVDDSSLKICNKLCGDTDQEGENQLECCSSISSSQNGGDVGDDDKDSSGGSS